MATIDESIKKIIAQKPWLKSVLTIASMILGYAKGRGWFHEKFGVK